MKIQDAQIKPEVVRLVNRYSHGHVKVTKEEWNALFLNSYERHLLYPCLDDEALLEVCKVCNENIFMGEIPVTYNQVAEQILFPLLITRLQEAQITDEDEEEQVYCHKCSKAGGANRPIYHGSPACYTDPT